MAEPQPEVGSTASSYAVLAKLATGGMAEIFLARTVSAAGVERYVVLKRVLANRANDTHFVRMFLDEARLAAQLQHPNIAQVYDTGVLGDSYFFSMEYVHGETVRDLVHRASTLNQPIPIACVLTIVAGAAAGLQHAHERNDVAGRPLGIVHRDVSPSNLMVSYDGNVKLVDFGVAKASHRSVNTEAGVVKGKISYLSPEQCRGRSVDHRSDLYALGIVMWEMLVGERLFQRPTDYENMEAITHQPSPVPSSRRPDVGPEVDAIVMKLLAKNPRDRYQSGDELLEAVEVCALGIGVSVSAAGLKRFVRELFGQRPEPWIELKAREAVPEVVTVTAAPLAGVRDVAIGDLRDSELARVLDLSTVFTPPPQPPPFVPTPPAPLQSVEPAPPPRRDATAVTVTASLEDDVPSRGSRRLGLFALLGIVMTMIVVIVILVASRRGPVADTQPVLAVVVDARPALAVAPTPTALVEVVDAGVALASPPDAVTANLPHPPPSRQLPAVHTNVQRELTPDDLLAAFHASRFAYVVAACIAAPKLVATVATCTLAACRAHDADHARSWLRLAPASVRDQLTAQCQASGTIPTPKRTATPAGSNCDDPMACR